MIEIEDTSMLGFLAPSGKFFECEYFSHINLATDLLEKVYKQQSNNPVDKLCKHGWIVIQSSFIGFSGDNFYHTPKLTKEQKEWLEDNKNDMSYNQQTGLKLCLELDKTLFEY